MRTPRTSLLARPAPPLWFLLLLCALEALVWRALGGAARDDGTAVAFWQIIGLIAGIIWTGVQVAGKVTLTILSWSVKVLWAFAIQVRNVAVAIGHTVVDVGRKAWDFLRLTYDEVLRPAWTKFWGWFDKLRHWVERAVGPVLDFLDRVRSWVMRFYDVWVRPILDAIGIARRVLNVLASLGLDWARALDQKLRWLEEKIEAPFRLAIAKINEVIGIVNRVVTADGLFQRVALIRTIERDMRFVGRALANWRSVPLTDADFDALRAQTGGNRTEAQMRADFIDRVTASGPHAARASEMAAIWRERIERR